LESIFSKQASGAIDNFLTIEFRQFRQHQAREHVATLRAFIAENAVEQ